MNYHKFAPGPQDMAMNFTKLTKDEMEIVKGAVMRGLGVGIDQKIPDNQQTQTCLPKVKPSASAGSSKDLARVQSELETPSTLSSVPKASCTQAEPDSWDNTSDTVIDTSEIAIKKLTQQPKEHGTKKVTRTLYKWLLIQNQTHQLKK